MSHYRLTARLGAGGMGVVYRARDERLARDVAVKLLPPALGADATARARLVQEARAAAALDHPHVASVYDVGETDGGQVFLAMAFYDGETLAERIARGPLDADEAAVLAAQVARALEAAHRAGVVHRDVKPANVMVLPTGGAGGGPCVKLLDFGIARVDGSLLTEEGQSLGTELYMSPEQILGDPVDERTDVWGVGALLYEMLAGQSAFGGLYPAAVSFNVLHRDPRDLGEDVPAPLAAVVARCLAKAPEDRYASMGALAEALGASAEAPPTGPPTPTDPAASTTPPASMSAPERAAAPRTSRVPRGAVLAGALLAAAAVGLALWLARGPEETTGEPPRLAVLPFRAVGADSDLLSAGLVETVTSKLSQFDPLRVRVRVVPLSEVGDATTPSDARERLDAALVIEGTVQVEDGRVRLSIRLVDVSSGEAVQLGSRDVDDASGSAFALQDAAVLQVADLLRVEVAASERDALVAGGTDDPEANALYLRGRGALRDQQSVEDLERAHVFFEEALGIDPEFALAHAGLAEAEWEAYRATDDVAWARRAIANAQRALGLDDRLAEVHTVQGKIHSGLGEYDLALESFDRALTLKPDDAEAVRQLGLAYSGMGRVPEAETAFRRAIALAPDSWRSYNSLGSFYLGQGRASDAARQYQRALDLDPGLLGLRYNLGVAAYRGGDLNQAKQAFRGVLDADSLHPGATVGLMGVLFTLNEYAEAVDAGEHAVTLLPDDYDARFGLAEARWWAGERDGARRDYGEALSLARENLRLGRTLNVLVAMAGAFAASGEPDSARVYLREIESATDPQRADVRYAYSTGVAYALVGDRDRALAWLRGALSRGYGQIQAERSPWLADLRSTSTF